MANLKEPVTDEDHIQGNKNAEITLLEYGDYQCPGCGQAFPIVKRVQKHFGLKLRFVFRNFPLTEVHPLAEPAAETAEFAATHGRFWEMHDLIYTNQDRLTLPILFELTKSLNMSEKELELVLSEGKFRPKIKNDFLSGIYSGVNGTPTFFINGQRHNGSFVFDDLIGAIEQLLVKE